MFGMMILKMPKWSHKFVISLSHGPWLDQHFGAVSIFLSPHKTIKTHVAQRNSSMGLTTRADSEINFSSKDEIKL